MDEQVRARALISGRVQGVFFRATCRERARELGLAGWARNLVDGAVEIVAQGPAEAVRSLLDWAAVGPAGAHVRSVEVAWEPVEGDESPFKVR